MSDLTPQKRYQWKGSKRMCPERIMGMEHFEHRLLLWLMNNMSEENIAELRHRLFDDMDVQDADDPAETTALHQDMLTCFDQVVEEAKEASDSLSEDVLWDWSMTMSAGECHAYFLKLLDRYYEVWKEKYAIHGISNRPSKMVFSEMYGCDKNKHYRLCRDVGTEKRYLYIDNVRAICFVCRMTYFQAVEFLWSACMPFNKSSERDQTLAHCLVKRIYDPEQVDAILEKNECSKLFAPFDEAREKREKWEMKKGETE